MITGMRLGEMCIRDRGEGEYNDNGTIRTVVPGDRTFTPSGFSHGMANNGDTDLVFMALIIYD